MSELDLESTATLIRKVHDGEATARDRLFERCLPLLKRWARGRLPRYGRDLAETDDLVQVTLMRALNRIDHFEPERQGAFLAYMRQILLNTVRDEIRRTQRASGKESLEEEFPEEAGLGGDKPAQYETIDQYERALAQLGDRQRNAIVLRVEFGMTFAEIASELEFPSANAARMQVSRGLVKLAESMA